MILLIDRPQSAYPGMHTQYAQELIQVQISNFINFCGKLGDRRPCSSKTPRTKPKKRRQALVLQARLNCRNTLIERKRTGRSSLAGEKEQGAIEYAFWKGRRCARGRRGQPRDAECCQLFQGIIRRWRRRREVVRVAEEIQQR